MTKKTVVVIGSGFFGIWVSNHVNRQFPHYNVKLITRSDYTYFLISSIRVPVTNDTEGSIIPLSKVVDAGVGIVKGEVNFFDDQCVKVILCGDDQETLIPFDAVVVATGAKWRDPIGYTYGFGDDYKEYFADQHRKMEDAKSIVLIGGGYTNVELAGELHDRYGEAIKKGEKKITMVHSKKLLLPSDGMYSEPLRQRCTEFFQNETSIKVILNTKAHGSDVNPGEVVCTDGTVLKADLVLTSIGVEPSVPANPFENFTNSWGFIRIDDTFRCKAAPSGNVFSIGDVTDFDYKALVKRRPWLKCIVSNIDSVLKNPKVKSKDLARVDERPGHVMALVSLGSKAGCGQLVLPFFGTVRAPEWLVRLMKSNDLQVSLAERLFKW